MTLKERAETLKRDVPAVFLALKDKETPVLVKALAGVTVAYALSPIDLIPDFIPVLGYLDDVILLPAMITLTIRLIPKDVWARCRAQSENLWADGKPKKWYYAIPIVVFWLLVIWWIVRPFGIQPWSPRATTAGYRILNRFFPHRHAARWDLCSCRNWMGTI